MSASVVDDTVQRLATVTCLLQHAAAKVWVLADQQPADTSLSSLGMGVMLAGAEVSTWIPDDCELPDLADQEDQGIAQLLAAAEDLTRPLPLHRLDARVGAELSRTLCDLVREARSLGH